MVEIRYFELTPAEQRRRLDQRQAEAPDTTWPLSDEELAEWAANIEIPTRGELDGSEPIDDPPAGFATWDEWRGYRWPPLSPDACSMQRCHARSSADVRIGPSSVIAADV
jgi:hypothetical protein